MLFSGLPGVDSRVTIPLRSRGWSQRGRRAVQNSVGACGTAGTIVGNSSFFTQNSQVLIVYLLREYDLKK